MGQHPWPSMLLLQYDIRKYIGAKTVWLSKGRSIHSQCISGPRSSSTVDSTSSPAPLPSNWRWIIISIHNQGFRCFKIIYEGVGSERVKLSWVEGPDIMVILWMPTKLLYSMDRWVGSKMNRVRNVFRGQRHISTTLKATHYSQRFLIIMWN